MAATNNVSRKDAKTQRRKEIFLFGKTDMNFSGKALLSVVKKFFMALFFYTLH
jgi:hypothetical protein